MTSSLADQLITAKWIFHEGGGGGSGGGTMAMSLPSSSSSSVAMATRTSVVPLGFIAGNFSSSVDDSRSKHSQQDKNELIMKSAMAVATAPGRQLMMTAFMLWMSGSSLQIFSIMMLGMSFWTPLKALLDVNTVFARYADTNVELLMPKLAYMGLNIAGIALATWKAQSMNLLPSMTGDGGHWFDTVVKRPLEVSVGSSLMM